ncbi:MAG TPA: LLM class flavin-dependent oxidoreductase, partial [Xanthobacteraceae bacterium]|nr:LLM class flavin-dependent oxidoreductase [Xanthobacteraceae bacterium]
SRTRLEVGTAVLLPALRNPVVLAHLVATLDQIAEGRLILGVGIAADVANIRAEFAAAGVPFDKRVGRMMEGLRLMRALWSGQPVNWDGRWKVERGVLGPTPYRPGGPPLWVGGSLPASIERAGRYFDGWMPITPDAAAWGRMWAEIKAIARAAGRNPDALTGSMYLNLVVDENAGRANERLDRFLENYYGQPAAVLRRWQTSYAGPAAGVAEFLNGYVRAGCSHLVLRFAGEHERHLEIVAGLRDKVG